MNLSSSVDIITICADEDECSLALLKGGLFRLNVHPTVESSHNNTVI